VKVVVQTQERRWQGNPHGVCKILRLFIFSANPADSVVR